jgi:hypothetical protein
MVCGRGGRTTCRLDPGEELAESRHWLVARWFHSNIMSPVAPESRLLNHMNERSFHK